MFHVPSHAFLDLLYIRFAFVACSGLLYHLHCRDPCILLRTLAHDSIPIVPGDASLNLSVSICRVRIYPSTFLML